MLASLVVSIDFLSFDGRVLVKLSNGEVTVWPPQVIRTKEPRRIRLNQEAREAITAEALKVFRVFGGGPMSDRFQKVGQQGRWPECETKILDRPTEFARHQAVQ